MEVFDRRLALANLEGNESRLLELLDAFQHDTPTVIRAMGTDLASADLVSLSTRAQHLGQSAKLLSAEGLFDLTRQILEAAQKKDVEQIGNLLSFMEMEFQWVERILDENRCSGNL